VDTLQLSSLTLGVENVGGVRGSYAIAGQFFSLVGGDQDGVLLSANDGATWRTVQILPSVVGQNTVIAGSYPTAQTWFVVGTTQGALSFQSGEELIRHYTHVPLNRSLFDATVMEGVDAWLIKYNAMRPHPKSKGEKRIGGGVFRTTDGGLSWQQVFATTAFNPTKIACPSANNCYLLGTGVRIFVSNNGGTTWTQSYFTNDPTEEIYDIACATALQCYATGGKLADFGGWFLYTENGGVNWTRVAAPTGHYPSAIDFRVINAVPTAVATSFSILGAGSAIWVSP
jgi:hypothetical protein